MSPLHKCNHPGCTTQVAYYPINVCGHESNQGCSDLFCSSHMTLVHIEDKIVLLCKKCRKLLSETDTFINGLNGESSDKDYQRMELNVVSRLVLKLKQGLDADRAGMSRVLTSTQSYSPGLSEVFNANPTATCFLSCLDLINSMLLFHSIVAMEKDHEIIDIEVVNNDL